MTIESSLAAAVLTRLREKNLTLATAESCTGGWVGKLLTDVAGSSKSYIGGVVSYTDRVKAVLLGVPECLLAASGAVSEPVARKMAEGACRAVGASVGASVTGLAGPDGDGSGKPVGLVYIAVCAGGKTVCRELHLVGGRIAIRRRSAEELLSLILSEI